MNGVQIEYLLGLFFLISSVNFSGGTFNADAFKFIAGLLLIVLAAVGLSLVKA